MKTESEIIWFIIERLAALLRIPKDEILTDAPLDSHYGLESMDILTLGGYLEDWLGIELDPDLIFQSRTVQSLASVVASAQESC